MCGVVAIYGPLARDRDALARALDAIAHRGPDGRGVFFDEEVALGHLRLATIDLAGGRQPIESEDGSVVAAVNGEIYDHRARRTELEARGHRFRTHTDSEVLIHLYEERGLDCFELVEAELAFVLWDRRRRRLFAGRDRFGVKPLVWAEIDGSLCLASEAKALFALGLGARWDREAYLQAASIQYPPPDRTLFEGVRQLLPGSVLVAEDGRWSARRVIVPSFLPESEKSSVASSGELTAELRVRFEAAVARRIPLEVPAAVALSGGLDSSAVLAAFARVASEPVHAFSVGFGVEGWDERALAAQSAEAAGAILHLVEVSAGDLIAHLLDAAFFGEGLAVNGHYPAKHLLHRAVREAGFKVILTGEGSDELFGGYPHFVRDLAIAQGADPAAVEVGRGAALGIMLPVGESLPLAAIERRLGFVPSFLAAKASLGHRLHQLFSAELTAFASAGDPLERILDSIDVKRELAGRHPVEQSARIWLELGFAPYLLRTLGDGTEMAHGIEGRLPFLDRDVFDLARRIPVSLKIAGDVEKHLLREALRGLVPEAIRTRRKHPFMAPPLSRFAGAEAKALLDAVVHSERFRRLPFYAPAKVESLLAALPALSPREQAAIDPALMILLSTWALAERFNL